MLVGIKMILKTIFSIIKLPYEARIVKIANHVLNMNLKKGSNEKMDSGNQERLPC